MKKLLIAALILLLGVSALAEEGGQMTGMVAEITEDGFALSTEEGIVFVIETEDTVVEVDSTMTAGDIATVTWSGRSDRKTVTADTVTSHALCGTVTEIGEGDEAYFLLETAEGETVRVNFGDVPADVVTTALPVTVYYSGAMTRSIPPQITAQYVRGVTLEGVIVEIGEEGELRLDTEDGEAIVTVSDRTIVLAALEEDAPVRVSVGPTALLSMPPRFEALDILAIVGE